MKNLKVIFALLTTLLVSGNAVAQNYEKMQYSFMCVTEACKTGPQVTKGASFSSFAQKREAARFDGINQFVDAIEDGNIVPLKFNSEFKSAMGIVFPEISAMGSNVRDHVFTKGLELAIAQAFREFGCLVNRNRTKQLQTDRCNGFVSSNVRKNRTLEKLPFSKGSTFYNEPLEVSYVHRVRDASIQYTITMDAGKVYNEKSIWYPVHRLGSFFGRNLDNSDLVTSMKMDVYIKDAVGIKDGPLLSYPLGFWGATASESEFRQAGNQSVAGNLAVSEANIIVADLRQITF